MTCTFIKIMRDRVRTRIDRVLSVAERRNSNFLYSRFIESDAVPSRWSITGALEFEGN